MCGLFLNTITKPEMLLGFYEILKKVWVHFLDLSDVKPPLLLLTSLSSKSPQPTPPLMTRWRPLKKLVRLGGELGAPKLTAFWMCSTEPSGLCWTLLNTISFVLRLSGLTRCYVSIWLSPGFLAEAPSFSSLARTRHETCNQQLTGTPFWMAW